MANSIGSFSRRMGWAILVASGWTAYVWGNRAVLLDEGSSWEPQARISVSLGFALALLIIGVSCLLPRMKTPRLAGWVLLAFGAWMAVAWVPEMIERLAAPDETLVFRLVHIGLAVVSLAAGSLTASYGRQLARGIA